MARIVRSFILVDLLLQRYLYLIFHFLGTMLKSLHLALIFVVSLHGFGQDDRQTYYERSGYLRTPRYDETMEYCRRLSAMSPLLTMGSFGKSAQGRDLAFIVADRDGLADPDSIRAAGRIIVLIQACIHPGESEGKDAGLMLMRDLAFRTVAASGLKEVLDRLSIVFIPIFNVDGHERFGPHNRINQNGPEEMGWRVTANNLNLNRDFLKADTPEMRAWLKMFSRWMPEFFIDTHTTDGADYQYSLTYLVEIFGNMDEGLTRWAKDTYIPALEANMAEAGFPVFPYVDFRNWHDPRSGLTSEVAPPMLSQGYTALRNRPGLLIETHMLKPYRVRVSSTYACIVTTLRILSDQAAELVKLERQADDWVSSPGFLNAPFPLQFQVFENDSTMVKFMGYDYTMEKSGISGGYWFSYNQTPAEMTLPWFRTNQPVFSVSLPAAYLIPAEWQNVITRLEAHGIRMTFLKSERKATVSTYRFNNAKWQVNPYEGRHPLTQFGYEEISEERMFPAGSAVVEVSQPAARIIAHLLEPKGNGSFVYWGFFDATFEQKEYAENYVLEKMALKMLEDDPGLRKEFEDKKTADTVFARNPQQILNWFYARSPYFDQRRNIYPVGRIMEREQLEALLRE
jgi:hypothetical protein